jgi:hypothetical protein
MFYLAKYCLFIHKNHNPRTHLVPALCPQSLVHECRSLHVYIPLLWTSDFSTLFTSWCTSVHPLLATSRLWVQVHSLRICEPKPKCSFRLV